MPVVLVRCVTAMTLVRDVTAFSTAPNNSSELCAGTGTGSTVTVKPSRRARTFHAFDDAFTGPSNGYRDAADYYARASAGPLLGLIRRPVLCISAEDDPMIPEETLPESVPGPWVQLLRTERGGHVGFLAGSVFRPWFWAEAQAVEFLARVSPQAAD